MKQKRLISFNLEQSAWLRVRDHAIRTRKTITDVVLAMVLPQIEKLPPASLSDSAATPNATGIAGDASDSEGPCNSK